MPFLKFKLSNWLIIYKGFNIMAIVVENNRIHYQIYFLTIRYCSLDQELYVINFLKLNSNYKWVFFKATVIEPLFQLINHINMGQDNRDTANTALFSSIYG